MEFPRALIFASPYIALGSRMLLRLCCRVGNDILRLLIAFLRDNDEQHNSAARAAGATAARLLHLAITHARFHVSSPTRKRFVSLGL